jgi:uncharacterized DUF497 family protein
MIVKYFEWNEEKNQKLKQERNVSFEEAIEAIFKGELLDVIENPSSQHKNQQLYVVKIKDYVYYVPFVDEEEKKFLKTIIPSRKATKKYLSKK